MRFILWLSDTPLTSGLTRRFVAFIAGAFAAVLLLITVIDPVFLHFEITQNRTVLFYLGVFTSILAVTRGVVAQDANVFEPETLLKEVVSYTHYMPGEWEGNLHSRKVSNRACLTAVRRADSESHRSTPPSAKSSK